MAFKKLKRSPRSRIVAERLMWGDLIGASPLVRGLAEDAKKETALGLSEDEVRQRIRSRMHSEGLTARAFLLPSLSRKMQRVKLRPVLRALADLIANKAGSSKLGPALEPLLEKIGWDTWLEDFIWHYAKTGEASPVFEAFHGKAFVHQFGKEGEKTPSVVLIATPASDVRSLVEEFIGLCKQNFPSETFSKRFEAQLEGARYFRMRQEGATFAQMAHSNIQERFPHLLTSDNDAEFHSYEGLVETERKRIERLAGRTFERADRIVDFLSPEES
jgi:hypothetical protein